MAELTPLEIEARRVAAEDLDRLFAGMLRRALVIMDGRAEKAFDADAHPRHPEGTPVDHDTGAGGGRFAAKEGGDVEQKPAKKRKRQRWLNDIFNGKGGIDAYNAAIQKMYAGFSTHNEGGFDTEKIQDNLGYAEDVALNRFSENLDGTEYDSDRATTEKYAKRTTQKIAEIVEQNPVAIRVSSWDIDSILADGRLKTQHETYDSNGAFDPEFREKVETEVMGVSPENRSFPVYGYVDFGNPQRVGDYGQIKLVLNEDVKDRTTITVGDSLGEYMDGTIFAVPLRNASQTPAYLGRKLFPTFKWVDTGASAPDDLYVGNLFYIEAQVHGGVSLKDVAYVEVLTDSLVGIDDVDEVDALAKKIRDAGLEVRRVVKRGA
jgi:hypothetical protein